MTIVGNRLYLTSFNTTNDMNPTTKKGGIRVYSKCMGVFLKCFGFATQIQEEGKKYFVNKKSWENWKSRHPSYRLQQFGPKIPETSHETRPETRPETSRLSEATDQLTLDEVNKKTITENTILLPPLPYAKGVLILLEDEKKCVHLPFTIMKDTKELETLQKQALQQGNFVTTEGKLKTDRSFTFYLLVQNIADNIEYCRRNLNGGGKGCFEPPLQLEDFIRFMRTKMGMSVQEAESLMKEAGFTFNPPKQEQISLSFNNQLNGLTELAKLEKEELLANPEPAEQGGEMETHFDKMAAEIRQNGFNAEVGSEVIFKYQGNNVDVFQIRASDDLFFPKAITKVHEKAGARPYLSGFKEAWKNPVKEVNVELQKWTEEEIIAREATVYFTITPPTKGTLYKDEKWLEGKIIILKGSFEKLSPFEHLRSKMEKAKKPFSTHFKPIDV